MNTIWASIFIAIENRRVLRNSIDVAVPQCASYRKELAREGEVWRGNPDCVSVIDRICVRPKLLERIAIPMNIVQISTHLWGVKMCSSPDHGPTPLWQNWPARRGHGAPYGVERQLV